MTKLVILNTEQELSDQEAKDISTLIISTLNDSNDGTYIQDQINLLAKYMSPEMIKKKANSAVNKVICSEGKSIIGYGVLAFTESDLWEIKTFYVSKQEQGIGSEMLKELESRARALRIKKLSIISLDFPNTIKFYEKRGYKVLAPITHNIDGIQMTYTFMQKEL